MKQFSISYLLIIFFLGIYGCDSSSIEPGVSLADPDKQRPSYANIVQAETREVIRVYEAAGTIRPLTESSIESQASAKILKVLCKPGDPVQKGQLLIRVDARRLEAQFKQAKEGLGVAEKQQARADKSINAARAKLNQAKAAYDRSQKLFKSAIISSQQLEQAESEYLQAKAGLEQEEQAKQAVTASVRQAREVVKEAGIAVGYTRILAPANGIIIQKLADPGDLAVPGKPLLIMQTSGALRLEANVREGFISTIKKGANYQVRIEALKKTVPSQVEEIQPYADPDSRTFLVKASLADTQGIYPGMFGRLLIPREKESTILIPVAAVKRIGQLELVNIKIRDEWQSVYVKTGKIFDDKLEVLSGLSGNETLGY